MSQALANYPKAAEAGEGGLNPQDSFGAPTASGLSTQNFEIEK